MLQTAKDAFRRISWHFHGKFPSLNKQEKQLKKIELGKSHFVHVCMRMHACTQLHAINCLCGFRAAAAGELDGISADAEGSAARAGGGGCRALGAYWWQPGELVCSAMLGCKYTPTLLGESLLALISEALTPSIDKQQFNALAARLAADDLLASQLAGAFASL